jgi:dTDP-glucose pyrophosphorylase
MAAGMGSRYGGLKQIEPVGPNGEIIIDYSIHDAILAGFTKAVFIIKEDFKKDFDNAIGNRVSKKIETEYAFQRADDLPEGFTVPSRRAKPWGTAHAVFTARKSATAPFAAINADDFYGRGSFLSLAEFLKNGKNDYAMVGYKLINTLSENGTVSRGVCEAENGYLKKVTEITAIEKFENAARYKTNGEWRALAPDAPVSINLWGFTPDIFGELENGFREFLKTRDLENSEFYIPTAVDEIIKSKKRRVKILNTDEKWFGVTYKEDREFVKNSILQMVLEGKYPEKL